MRSLSLVLLSCLLAGRAWGQVEQQVLVSVEPLYKGLPIPESFQQYIHIEAFAGARGFCCSPIAGPLFGAPLGTPIRLKFFGGHNLVYLDQSYPGQFLATTLRPDLSQSSGTVRGRVRVNGANPPFAYYFYVNNAYSVATGVDGSFRMLLPAGFHHASVNGGGQGANHGYSSFTLSPGQDLDLGILAVSAPQGTVLLEPTFHGQPMSAVAPTQVLVHVPGFPQVPEEPLRKDQLRSGQTSWPYYFGPGTYLMQLRSFTNSTLASGTATVTSGATTYFRPELNGTMGLVRGQFHVNGTPRRAYVYSNQWPQGLIDLTETEANGFRWLLPAGSYSLRFVEPSFRNPAFYNTYHAVDINMAVVNFTLSAGQDLNLGVIAGVTPTANLVVEPLYNGQPLSTLASGISYNLYAFLGYSDLPSGDGSISPSDSSATSPVPAGPLNPADVKLISQWLGFVSEAPGLVFPPNQTFSYRPELRTTMGLVRGVPRVNGAPMPSGFYFEIDGLGYIQPGGDGSIRALVKAGVNVGRVRNVNSSELLYSFPFNVVAGQETVIGGPQPLQFNMTVQTGITPAPGKRFWPMRLTNTGVAVFDARVTNLAVARVSGPATCTPTVLDTTPPLRFGDMATGASGTWYVPVNFTGCTSANRFSLTATVTNGDTSQTITRTNLFQ